MTMAKDPWSMDPKQKPKTKKQTTPTPLFYKKGSYDTTQGARVRLLMVVKTFSLGIVTLKKFCKILNEFGYSRHKQVTF